MKCELCGAEGAIKRAQRVTAGVYRTVMLCDNEVECWQRWDNKYLNKTKKGGVCIHKYQKLVGDESYSYCDIDDRMVEGSECDTCSHYQTKS